MEKSLTLHGRINYSFQIIGVMFTECDLQSMRTPALLQNELHLNCFCQVVYVVTEGWLNLKF